MKHLNNMWLLSAGFVLLFGACKKDKDKDPDPGKTPESYVCATCVKNPEANAQYDGSSRGIYKGILIASTGTVKFNIGNDGNTVTALMVIDGTSVTLTSSVVLQEGEPYIAPFTGTLNGQELTLNFYVSRDGTEVRITSSDIPGHPNAVFELVKETSSALIEGFEGRYSSSNGEKGTFNVLLSRALKRWGGVARQDGDPDEDDINGSLEDGKIIDRSNGRQVGTLSGDKISGSFQDSKGRTITIDGKRTL